MLKKSLHRPIQQAIQACVPSTAAEEQEIIATCALIRRAKCKTRYVKHSREMYVDNIL